ncbi:MAG: T9SS type A sorting domain-containing protein [Flavobacteriales bacterium]|nr:T9SS type A sorting domain-containing protein [Flavobacteriales bacterium]
MNLPKTILLVFVYCCTFWLKAEVLNIGILSGKKVTSFIFSPQVGTYTIFPDEQYINAQHRIYRMLNQQPGLKDNSMVLTDFYHSKLNSSIAQLATVEHTLALGELDAAATLLAALSPANAIDANYKNYYIAYLHYKTRSCTSTDSLALWQMATGCAARDGDIIHQARSLFNLLYQKDYTIYFDDCSDTVKTAKTNRFTTINTQQNRQEQFAVFPNPSNGELWIKAENGLIGQSTILIFDIAGKIVYEKSMLINNTVQIAPELKQGTYFIQIIPNNYSIKPFKEKITIIE